ncbi:hypothetical protein FVE85_3457 [Porphyridium purpureum]|uniref:Uncharacterized protein n=1 Tax=Porphyridium purpureum TaxID=35688 RepID=A0A5J4YFW3_PORPP|nr:hypothetical protein FVE85_3457 [Porphyridium purpureum]|eukprot:POR6386..scf228_30
MSRIFPATASDIGAALVNCARLTSPITDFGVSISLTSSESTATLPCIRVSNIVTFRDNAATLISSSLIRARSSITSVANISTRSSRWTRPSSSLTAIPSLARPKSCKCRISAMSIDFALSCSRCIWAARAKWDGTARGLTGSTPGSTPVRLRFEPRASFVFLVGSLAVSIRTGIFIHKPPPSPSLGARSSVGERCDFVSLRYARRKQFTGRLRGPACAKANPWSRALMGGLETPRQSGTSYGRDRIVGLQSERRGQNSSTCFPLHICFYSQETTRINIDWMR